MLVKIFDFAPLIKKRKSQPIISIRVYFDDASILKQQQQLKNKTSSVVHCDSSLFLPAVNFVS